MLAETGADELMVVSDVYDHALRLRSFELIAEAAGIGAGSSARRSRGLNQWLLSTTFPLVLLDGRPASLAEHAGKVLLIVNVASQCGLTPQYEGLEDLDRAYRDRGLVVLGFPANDFGGQEPGTDEEIGRFCRSAYGVDFPMFSKIAVAAPDRHPLYGELIAAAPQAAFGRQQASIHARRRRQGSGRHPLELREVPGRPRRVRHRPLRPDTGPTKISYVSAIEAALAA